MSSGGSQIVGNMTIRQIHDASREFVDERAEHKVRTGITALAADVARIDRDVTAHKHDLNGNGKPGIKAQLLLGEQRMTNIETSQRQGLDLVEKKFGELSAELRELFDTVTQPGKKRPGDDEDDDDKRKRRKKDPLIDRDTLRLILTIIAGVITVGGTNVAYQVATTTPQEAVQVQAEAVAEKSSDLEKREESLRRREAWVAKQIAAMRTNEPTMPEPAPESPTAPASAE